MVDFRRERRVRFRLRERLNWNKEFFFERWRLVVGLRDRFVFLVRDGDGDV